MTPIIFVEDALVDLQYTSEVDAKKEFAFLP